MINIGFTGTRDGMTPPQRKSVAAALNAHPNFVFHHGDCVGADAEASTLAEVRGALIHLHPPLKKTRRAFMPAHFVHPAKEYLERNRDIVDASDFIIAAPQTQEEKLRSGTWSTIRYALRQNKNVLIIWPDGSSTYHNASA